MTTELKLSELWVALEQTIRRLQDHPDKVLFGLKAEYEGGLNIARINELAPPSMPVFSVETTDDEQILIVNHPTLPDELAIRWLTWARNAYSRDSATPDKVKRTIEYLRTWQSLERETQEELSGDDANGGGN